MICILMHPALAMTLGLSCAAVLAQSDPEYPYAVFRAETLGPDHSVTWSVNSVGVVVGGSFPTGENVFHAYVWDGKHTIDLGTFGGPDSEAWDVNDADTVVGWADTAANRPHAFVWTPQTGLVDLGTFGGQSSKAYAISNGTVVGSANFLGDDTAHAFLWNGDDLVDLGSLEDSRISFAYDLNQNRVVVGESHSLSLDTSRPVMWKDEQIIDLGSLGDGTHRGSAFAINDLDQVVGESWDDDKDNYPFIWVDGQMHKINQGNGYSEGFARDINNNTQVVGTVYRGNKGFAFLWDPQTGLHDLEDQLPPRTGYELLVPSAITDSGMISVWGPFLYSDAYLLVPVDPELTLSDPVPGVVDQTNNWTVTGAQPGAKIYFAYSLKGGGTVVPGCDKLDAVVQLNKPKVVKTVTADANGDATIDLYVPPAASNAGLILFQAVDQQHCEESQLTTYDFE